MGGEEKKPDGWVCKPTRWMELALKNGWATLPVGFVIECGQSRKTRTERLQRPTDDGSPAHRNIVSHAQRMYTAMKTRAGREEHYFNVTVDFERDEFLDWLFFETLYCPLYHTWKASGYSQKLTPTVDRLDSHLSYSFGNIRILTFSQNCAIANKSRPRRGKSKASLNRYKKTDSVKLVFLDED